MAEVQTKETHGFQTEVRKLLDLMVHSLYSNKEIFLRELISNASDAADKLRFEALSDDGLYEGDGELKVRVSFDPDARTVTVRDNGIGMTREEIASNLGTIARSGTRQFFESLTGDSAKDTQLIGQFGVGFYSCFIVADSRHRHLAPRRPWRRGRRALGVERRGQVHRRDRRCGAAGHRSGAASTRRRGTSSSIDIACEASCASTPTTFRFRS